MLHTILKYLYINFFSRFLLFRNLRNVFILRRNGFAGDERTYHLRVLTQLRIKPIPQHDDFIILNNATVIGKSTAVVHGDKIILFWNLSKSHFAKVIKQFYLLEEFFGWFAINLDSQSITEKLNPSQLKLYGTWVSFSSHASENWMHFISEVLPRMIRFSKIQSDVNFGIVLDDSIPPSAMQLCKLIFDGTPTVVCHRGQKVVVENLLVNSTPNSFYLCWPRNSDSPERISVGVYDSEGLLLARNYLFKKFNLSEKFVKKRNKLYVKRKSFFRKILNESEVSENLLRKGFKSIEPGSLNLVEQANLFNQAGIVVAQAGAAMANIIFMPRGSLLICLVADSEWKDYAYFNDYARIFGVRLVYIEGQVIHPNKYDKNQTYSVNHPLNADFNCPIEMLMEEIEVAFE